MLLKFKKNVSLLVHLEIGDDVITEGWGPNLDGRTHVIEEIKLYPSCESGVMVKINNWKNPIDSGWLKKISTECAGCGRHVNHCVCP